MLGNEWICTKTQTHYEILWHPVSMNLLTFGKIFKMCTQLLQSIENTTNPEKHDRKVWFSVFTVYSAVKKWRSCLFYLMPTAGAGWGWKGEHSLPQGPWACFARRSTSWEKQREEGLARTERAARTEPGRLLGKGRTRQEWTSAETARWQLGPRENCFNQGATESWKNEHKNEGKDNTSKG